MNNNTYRVYINSSTVLTANDMFRIVTQEKRNEVVDEALKIFRKNSSKEEFKKFIKLFMNRFEAVNSQFRNDAKTLLNSTKYKYTTDEIFIMMLYYPKEKKFKEKFNNFCSYASVDKLKQLKQKMKNFKMVK